VIGIIGKFQSGGGEEELEIRVGGRNDVMDTTKQVIA